MRSDSRSIQQLLVAEKRADEKIGVARKRKADRLKQAKDEAKFEMEKFRTEKENEFKDYESKYLGSRENSALRIEAETVTKLNEMKTCVATEKDQVIEYLLGEVFLIKPSLHQNLLLKRSNA